MLVEVPIGQISLEEYLALDLPETLTELVDGQVIVNASPSGPHQRLVGRLYAVLDAGCPPGYEVLVSPIDWVLWGDPRATVREPDMAVVRGEQADELRLTEPPLLVVEALSPDSFERDVVAKRRDYARAGLAHYWIANPRTGEVIRYHLSGDELVEAGRLVPGRPNNVTEPFTVTFDPGELTGRRRTD
jgi:Uma2 family endonuclease